MRRGGVHATGAGVMSVAFCLGFACLLVELVRFGGDHIVGIGGKPGGGGNVKASRGRKTCVGNEV